MSERERMEFLINAAQLSAQQEQEFITQLRDILKPDELTALLTCIGYVRLYYVDGLRAAIKKSLAKELFDRFNN